MTVPTPVEDLVAAIPAPGASRFLIGIVGAPGSGKSTLAARLCEDLRERDGEVWQTIGMDGFHLSNRVLVELGRRNRKGAPDTFDVSGFVTLLRRLRTETTAPVYAPVFHREVEESIAAEASIPPSIGGLIVEGNYLLHESDGWETVRSTLDVCWFLDTDANDRRHRLIERATATYGSSGGTQWVDTVDEPNARVVEATRPRADRVVSVDSRKIR